MMRTLAVLTDARVTVDVGVVADEVAVDEHAQEPGRWDLLHPVARDEVLQLVHAACLRCLLAVISFTRSEPVVSVTESLPIAGACWKCFRKHTLTDRL